MLDFSQFLSGPSCGLRLADMGARVIKVERSGTGDICRQLYVSDTTLEGGESTIFHAVNRNKESYCINLKDENALHKIKKLMAKADVVIHNFRPGVMQKIGLDYPSVFRINPQIIYGEISGYGTEGEWSHLPGQDLLLQAVSGITYNNAEGTQSPVPLGVAVADIMAGTHLAQGILACLLQRLRDNKGAYVQISMLESLLDFQFEVLTRYLNKEDCNQMAGNVSDRLSEARLPDGIYKTADGFIAIANASLASIAQLEGCSSLKQCIDTKDLPRKTGQIKNLLAEAFSAKSTAAWLSILKEAHVCCTNVLNYEELLKSEGYKLLQMEQEVISGGIKVRTTRCPVWVDGQILASAKGAPALGEHNNAIDREFCL